MVCRVHILHSISVTRLHGVVDEDVERILSLCMTLSQELVYLTSLVALLLCNITMCLQIISLALGICQGIVAIGIGLSTFLAYSITDVLVVTYFALGYRRVASGGTSTFTHGAMLGSTPCLFFLQLSRCIAIGAVRPLHHYNRMSCVDVPLVSWRTHPYGCFHLCSSLFVHAVRAHGLRHW